MNATDRLNANFQAQAHPTRRPIIARSFAEWVSRIASAIEAGRVTANRSGELISLRWE